MDIRNIDGIFSPLQVCLGNEVFDMAEACQSYRFKKMKYSCAVTFKWTRLAFINWSIKLDN